MKLVTVVAWILQQQQKKMIIILALKSVLPPGRPYHTSSLDLAFFSHAFLGVLAHFSCET